MPIFVERLSARKFSAASSTALDVFVGSESNARVTVDAGGKITWGTGSSAGDVTLYRAAANLLQTDDAFKPLLGVVNLTYSGAPSGSSDDGTVAVDTTNDAFYFRSSGSWQQVSGGGASLTVQDGAPSSPTAGDLWFESDTGNTIVYYDDGVGAPQWVEIGHSIDSSTVDLNLDGGLPNSNYGGVNAVDGGAP